MAAGGRCRARLLVKSPFLKEGVLESDTLQPQYIFYSYFGSDKLSNTAKGSEIVPSVS